MSYRLGVVLSGGGARGIAHAGVLQALRENGIDIDCLACTSSGAIVGAFHAAGRSTEEILEFFMTRNPFRLSNLTVAKPGFIDTAKVRGNFLKYLPDDSFAALQKRLFVTATDIINGKPVVFDSGPLISAILASSSVPGVFTPTEIDGRLYADGGIMNNFPVEPLIGICDVIIGVYASPLQKVQRADLGSSFAVVQRALQMGIFVSSKTKFHACDVMIYPEGLNDYGNLDTKHVREIYELGYQAGLDHVAQIERALEALI